MAIPTEIHKQEKVAKKTDKESESLANKLNYQTTQVFQSKIKSKSQLSQSLKGSNGPHGVGMLQSNITGRLK